MEPARTRETGSRRRRAALATALVAGMLTLPSLRIHPVQAAPGDACASAPIDARFGDVRSGGTFTAAIRCVAGYGLVGGYDDDTYRPGAKVTRGEAAKFVLEMIETARGQQLPAASNPFRDVSSSGVLGPYIVRLAGANVVTGKHPKTFAPGDPLTRGEMSKIIARALQKSGMALDSTDVDYADVPDDGVFATAISKLTNAGVVQGVGGNRFGPSRRVTRGQLAAFVANGLRAVHRVDRWLPTRTDEDWRQLRGSLEHLRQSVQGPRTINVLRWRLDDPKVKLRVDYAGGVTYRSSVLNAARRRDAVAAVNGGFWVNNTDPDGLLVRDGRLYSDTSVLTDGHRNIRSAFALQRGNTPVVGVPFWYASLTMDRPDGKKVSVRVDGVNRPPFAGDEVVLYNPGTHAQRTSRPGRYYVFRGTPELNANGTHDLQLARMHVGNGPVSAGNDETLLWVAGEVPLDRIPDDRAPTLRVQVDPAWERSRVALSAGPWLLADGEVTTESQWRSEGFTGAHTDVRHPRTAIGFTDDGWGVILTVDGRRAGSSVGSTHQQVAEMMRSWGVTNAVMLDGGGSTQMAVQGQVANRPCCDIATRAVATVVLLEPTG